MTRAEQKARDAYPNRQDWERELYAEGYQQAEKDLALTWDDIKRIHNILIDLRDDEDFPPLSEELYKEVLKRFNTIQVTGFSINGKQGDDGAESSSGSTNSATNCSRRKSPLTARKCLSRHGTSSATRTRK